LLLQWKRVARTPKAYQLERVLWVLEARVREGTATVAEILEEHTAWVQALRTQNRIHAFRD